MPYVRHSPAKIRRWRANRFAIAWHAGWVLVVGAAMVVLVLRGLLAPGPEFAALAAIVAAGVFAALLTLVGQSGQALAILVWGSAGAAACQLTGGPAGPLAAWCLAPLAAAAVFRVRGLLALGAAAALAATGVSALSAALAPLPSVSPELASWISQLALATISFGLTSGFIVLYGGFQHEERRRGVAERALHEVLKGQPQQILMLDQGGRVQGAFGPSLTGFEADDLTNHILSDLAVPDDRPAVDEALAAAVRDRSAVASFAPAGHPDGWVELSLRRLDQQRILGAVRDARAERALDKARETAEQQNASKSRFLANMSHELRTPLNAIMGFSDIMQQRLFGPLADRYVEYAGLIHESGSHLLELINDVLDMSKIEAERFELTLEPFDAREAVSAVLRLMRGQADRAGIGLRGVLPADPLHAEADRRALKQITLNLISNALKFTPKNGTVTVTVQAAGESLELIVADTGIGIAPADLARLGQPFEQAGDAERRVEGSGLGLSLVRSFAVLHGGEMTIESALGQGTTIIVRMPVLRSPKAAGGSASRSAI